jgi:uncharacterized protein
MTPEEFTATVGRIMGAVTTMTLATCAGGVPWATDVYFAPDGFDLVFFSSPNSRHCCNLATNPACAITIHPVAASWQEISGLQMEGVCEPVSSGVGKMQAGTIYFRKFPFARTLISPPQDAASLFTKATAHVFRPTYLRLIDNRRGLGTRFYIRLVNGKPVGPPEAEIST